MIQDKYPMHLIHNLESWSMALTAPLGFTTIARRKAMDFICSKLKQVVKPVDHANTDPNILNIEERSA